VQQLREELGLNLPIHKQYVNYLYSTLTGDLGKSFITQRPVITDLVQKFKYTFQLAAFAMLVAIPLGICFGIIAAVNKGSMIDKLLIVISLAGISAPVFWIALLLILVIGLYLQWLPPTGFGGIKFLILPAIALGTRSLAMIVRLTRTYILDVLNEDYIRTAIAKGLSTKIILFKHALRNALVPLITIIASDFGSYLSGAVLTESIFGWPGLGRFALNAIMKRDFPAIQGTVLFTAIIIVLINIIVEIIYAYVDPRVRDAIIDE